MQAAQNTSPYHLSPSLIYQHTCAPGDSSTSFAATYYTLSLCTSFLLHFIAFAEEFTFCVNFSDSTKCARRASPQGLCKNLKHAKSLAWFVFPGASETISPAWDSCDDEKLARSSARTTCNTFFAFSVASAWANRYRKVFCGPQNVWIVTFWFLWLLWNTIKKGQLLFLVSLSA